MTSDGAFSRIRSSAPSRDRAKTTAHAELGRRRLDLRGEHEIVEDSKNHEQHTMLRIETQAIGPFMKNGFVVGCEKTREAVLIDPGDEVAGLLDVRRRGTRWRSATSC